MLEITDSSTAPDAQVTVAHILSRGEAMVVVAQLAAASIPTCVGGLGHLSLLPIAVALGGYRVSVPVTAYEDASALLSAMPGETPVDVLLAFRRRIWRFILAWFGTAMAAILATAAMVGSLVVMLYGLQSLVFLIFSLHLPPPPWRGDYYLQAMGES